MLSMLLMDDDVWMDDGDYYDGDYGADW